MPYLTPEDVPEERDCRALLIPAGSEWLAIFSGALTELTKSWNWERQGITVDEALAVVNQVIDAYYEGCVSSGCTLPDGEGIFRVNQDGKLEQLVNGEWVAPQGEYALPPVPPREGTPEDARCLAAANAENVMAQLYEQVIDGISDGLGTLEIALLIASGVLTLINPVLGVAVLAAIKLVLLIVNEFVEAAKFLSADLWDTQFSEALRCILYECAADDGSGVITFDNQCVNEGLYDNSLHSDLSGDQIRLLWQVGHLIQFMGGMDGVNLAGATTAITSSDCEICNDCLDHCSRFDFLDAKYSMCGWRGYITLGAHSDWLDGIGWRGSVPGNPDRNCVKQVPQDGVLYYGATVEITPAQSGGGTMYYWFSSQPDEVTGDLGMGTITVGQTSIVCTFPVPVLGYSYYHERSGDSTENVADIIAITPECI